MAGIISISANGAQLKPAALRNFHRRLATWYGTHGRHDLPWRNTADPYRIWISEVMLQQTQVATVRARFYAPFLAKFPSVEALAAAPREAVMKAWEGLGYYRRAGFLHEAAKQLSDLSPRARPGVHLHNTLGTRGLAGSRHKAGMTVLESITLPDSIDELLVLPGIGRNTAHAILAFAYHQPVAILEANVKRVVARVFALEHPSDADLWAGADMLLNRAAPFDYNQAMMDLGSMVCTPKKPACGECPAHGICAGKTAPERYPAPKVKKQIPTREVVIQVREDARGRLFLERRAEALLGGLYGFPQVPLTPSSRRRSESKATMDGLSALPEIPGQARNDTVGTVVHVYSHFKLIGHVVHEKTHAKPNSADWHTREEIAALPLSKLDHKVLALVENCHSAQKKHSKPKPARHKH